MHIFRLLSVHLTKSSAIANKIWQQNVDWKSSENWVTCPFHPLCMHTHTQSILHAEKNKNRFIYWFTIIPWFIGFLYTSALRVSNIFTLNWPAGAHDDGAIWARYDCCNFRRQWQLKQNQETNFKMMRLHVNVFLGFMKDTFDSFDLWRVKNRSQLFFSLCSYLTPSFRKI